MDNKQVTAEWIAQQRAVCAKANEQIFSMEKARAEAAIVFELFAAALDALEAAYAEIARLTAERDAAVKIIRDARVYLDELGSPQYCLYQLMKWPCDENGGEKDDH